MRKKDEDRQRFKEEFLDKLELQKDADVFLKLLIFETHDTLLPEIFDAFGRELIIRFLNIFAGCTIRVPKLACLRQSLRKAIIYRTLHSVKGKKLEEEKANLCLRYGLTEDGLDAIDAYVSQILECLRNAKQQKS